MIIVIILVSYRKYAVSLHIEMSKRLTRGCAKVKVKSKIQVFRPILSKSKSQKVATLISR